MKIEDYKMNIYCSYSSGKDSHASLIWAVKEYGSVRVKAVFCHVGWDHAFVYAHAKEVCELLGVELIILKSIKYDGMLDLVEKKKRFPSVKARFCTEELKSKPMIDFILDKSNGNALILQGIRKDESESRSKMLKKCTFFKHYFTPYKINKNGKPMFHAYRKKEVVEFCSNFQNIVYRPVFDNTANEVLNYILEAGHKPNPLYYYGFSRVGCMPCIMCTKNEVKIMVEKLPDYAQRLIDAEDKLNILGQRSNFFGPGYIPYKYCAITYIKKVKVVKKKTKEFIKYVDKIIGIPSAKEVFSYVTRFASQTELDLDENKERSCMSHYGICN